LHCYFLMNRDDWSRSGRRSGDGDDWGRNGLRSRCGDGDDRDGWSRLWSRDDRSRDDGCGNRLHLKGYVSRRRAPGSPLLGASQTLVHRPATGEDHQT